LIDVGLWYIRNHPGSRHDDAVSLLDESVVPCPNNQNQNEKSF
jgi:hypothetical protein